MRGRLGAPELHQSIAERLNRLHHVQSINLPTISRCGIEHSYSPENIEFGVLLRKDISMHKQIQQKNLGWRVDSEGH